jgi:hypothetical protein
VTVKLYAPGIADPVQVWELDQQLADITRFVTYESQGFPTPDAPGNRTGWWRCTVTPVQDITEIYLSAEGVYARAPLRTKPISARLFRNLFRVAFEAVVPDVRIENGTITASAARELHEAYDVVPAVRFTKSLPSHVTP